MAAKSKKSGAGGRLVNHEEADLWQEVTGNVKPLPGHDEMAKQPLPPKPTRPAAKKQTKPAARIPDPRAETPPDLADLAETPASTDWRTARKLKKGKMAVEARIDLHGMTQEQAYGALSDFLWESHGMGRRCVLVITGKGRGGSSSGVLRSAVPKWLNQPSSRQKIISITPAAPRDGGDGALYVLLKRKR